MRTSDVAYVSNPAQPTYVPPLEDMNLQEITKMYLRTCAKSGGHLSVCRTCESKCKYGARALDLYMGKVFESEPVNPDMTIIARMKAEQEKKNQARKPETKTFNRAANLQKSYAEKRKESEDWYRAAIQSPDPVAYTMEKLGYSKTQAKNKIYNFRYYSPEKAAEIEKEVGYQRPENKKKKEVSENKTVKTEPIQAEREEKPMPSEDDFIRELKNKAASLESQKLEYQNKISEYTRLLKEISDKVDALNMCMEAFHTGE